MASIWQCMLVLPDGRRFAGASEGLAFEELTPVPDTEVRDTIALALMGVAASAACGDFTAFASAPSEMQLLGFKAREISAQPESVRALLQEISCIPQCAAGMSSMGPLLFAIFDGGDTSVQRHVVEIATRYDATVQGPFSFRNTGFDIS